jgi:hypothetical protein
MSLERSQLALRPAVAPPNEQPYVEAELSAPVIDRAPDGRIMSATAARAMAKLPRRGAFVPRKIATDPRFEVHNRARGEWFRKRRKELIEMTGGLSQSVQAMLSAAGWLYAAADFACERGAETGDLDWFKSAATLSATARTHDVGSWEIAVREGAARTRPGNANDPLAGFRVQT